MKITKEVNEEKTWLEIIGYKCDVCKKDYLIEDNIYEVQEFKTIKFTGGYGSVFGDDDSFEINICQHCLKEKLGEYIRRTNEIQ